MKRKNVQKRGREPSPKERLLPIVLALTLALTPSGAASLAEESGELPGETIVMESSEADAQAQPGEEAAAAQAEAEAASQEQAAEEEAARLAAEQSEAEEAARLEAEQSGAEEEAEAVPDAETEEEAGIVYQAAIDGIDLTVEFPAGALPDEAVLNVIHYYKDSAEYQEAAALLNIATDEAEVSGEPAAEKTNLELFDIYFTVNDYMVEPGAEISIRFELYDFLKEDENADRTTLKVWYSMVSEEGTPFAVLIADTEDQSAGTVNADSAEIEFKTVSMQKFSVTWTDYFETEMAESESEAQAQAEAEEAARIAEEQEAAEQAAAEEAARAAAEQSAAEAAAAMEAETEAAEDVIYQAVIDNICLTAEVPAGALSDEAVLNAIHYEKDSEEYQEAAALLNVATDEAEVSEEPAAEKTNLELFDIYFTVNNERTDPVMDPDTGIIVRIEMHDFLEEDENADRTTLKAWHFVISEEGTPAAVLAADIEAQSGGTVDANAAEIEFHTASMQKFSLTWTDYFDVQETESEIETETESETETEIHSEIETEAE